MKYLIIVLIIINAFTKAYTQGNDMMDHSKMLHVTVLDNEKTPLVGAYVFWANTLKGNTTNESGMAMLNIEELPNKIVISYVGYEVDTILIEHHSEKHFNVALQNIKSLDEVVVSERKQASTISRIEPIKTEIINAQELTKAACCNLSESFETNSSVDVSYSDAVTGAKEITFLGLDGVYVQILTDNIPSIRGMASSFGLTYIPGSWINRIAISKGSGSIINGYESITGSISLNYKDDFEKNKFYVDIFGNHLGRLESNFFTNIKVHEKWSTMLAGNWGLVKNKTDNNDDSFLDQPLINRYAFMNKWRYKGDKLRQQFSIKVLHEDRDGGQIDFNEATDRGTNNAYGIGIKTNRIEGFHKGGIILKGNPKSIALLNSIIWHDESNFFGTNEYNGTQINYNTNFIFESIINTTDHHISVGGSFIYDNYDETYNNVNYDRKELVPGVFAEYTYSYLDKIKIIGGLRADYHNIFGVQITPRVHAKFNLSEKTILRVSGGKGFRTTNIFAEEKSLLASSRTLQIEDSRNFESAWNYGINITQNFELGNREGYVSADFYRTNFIEKQVIDVDQGDNTIHVYNSKDKAYSNSFLIEASYEIFPNFDLKISYKLDDTKQVYNGVLRQKFLTDKHRGLITASYTTPNKEWQFDLNSTIHGRHRLSDEFEGASAFAERFAILNLKVEKFFKKGIDVYVGAENVTNFRQPNPIIGADNPFGDEFDTSQVWGPIIGGLFYGGMRFTLK